MHSWIFGDVLHILFTVQATALLQTNLENAKASLEVLVADLQFLRDQVTITQVGSAFNSHLGLMTSLCLLACDLLFVKSY